MPNEGLELIPANSTADAERPDLSVEAVAEQRGADIPQWRLSSGKLLRVLVADANKDTADSLVVLARLWGHDARQVYDGPAALAMADAYQPDILISDIAMPQINGCQLARHLRCQARFKYALFIVVSGHADEAHRRLALEAEFDIYVVKPAQLSILQTLLWLERYRLARFGEVADKANRTTGILIAEYSSLMKTEVQTCWFCREKAKNP